MKWNAFSCYTTTTSIMIIQCKIHKLDKFDYSEYETNILWYNMYGMKVIEYTKLIEHLLQDIY